MLMKVRTSVVMSGVALASALAVVQAPGAFAQTSGQSQGTRQAQAPARGSQQQEQEETATRVSGIDVPFTSSSGEEGAPVVNGIFTIQRFVHEGSRVLAVGKISATTSNAEGRAQNFVTQARLPVLPATAPSDVCSTLHLELGPLDVELSKLRLQADQIAVEINAPTVDVTRAPTAQNELGTQLCSVGGLLDRGGASNAGAQLAALLNKVLALIG